MRARSVSTLGASYRTCKDGDDGLVDRSDLLLLEEVAGEEGNHDPDTKPDHSNSLLDEGDENDAFQPTPPRNEVKAKDKDVEMPDIVEPYSPRRDANGQN